MIEATEQARQVIALHWRAFQANDLQKVLSHYADEALFCTPDGPLKGKQDLEALYREMFKLLPANETHWEFKQTFVDDNRVYCIWMAESPLVRIPIGSDTFILEDGKIVYQTFAGYLTPQEPGRASFS
ncbi:nuclear transport factor 2 family protein [Pontibacter sp. G13]|uniref:nuclear transport factor 2 family protein n=1 Tax=Pontibacter sp. G13 TaxID=3074898 RepID=UPI00288A69F7|nr:nuclear transport factor 2 family protein [Pontibacter sp. G13]WNJ18490.1 nuclear transport factor 2 family protein [Pontibacter sp. G13]